MKSNCKNIDSIFKIYFDRRREKLGRIFNFNFTQMKTAETLIILILCCLVFFASCAREKCPSSCNCTAITFNCSRCLHSFYRVYNSQTQDCECLTGFKEMVPARNSCCPTNCSQCTYYGCFSCRKNWVNVIDYNLLAYTC